MAVAFARVGTWAEFTTDLQTVAIPASTAAGERMFLWVQWKDQSITLATPSGWNLVSGSNFSDGSTGTGNGTGSMRQSVFWRDWQSGDANPQLDFSTATGLLAEAVIINFTKGASDTWGTPVAVSAAHSWGTSSTTTSASSSSTIRGGAVVMCGVAVRDDSATMTRPTTGIDVASGITWNGNYAEQPATHYSTTTGDDHSGDLGYRLVAAGGGGSATLRATGTISAAETGSLVWVVQGANNDQAPTPASPTALALSTFAPTVTKTNNQRVTPTTLALTTSRFAPVLKLSVVPPVKALSLAGFAPSVTLPKLVTPPTKALSMSAFAPSVSATANQRVTPTTAALSASTFAPTVSTPRLVTPGAASLATSRFSPTVLTPRTVTPGSAGLSLSASAPSVSTPRVVTPAPQALSLTAFAPGVLTPRVITPPVKALQLTTYAPQLDNSVVVVPGAAGLGLAGFAPSVTASDHKSVIPLSVALAMAGFAPTVITPRLVTPPSTALSLAPFPPTVTVDSGLTVTPDPAALVLTGFAPDVDVTAAVLIVVGGAALALATFPPSVETSEDGLNGDLMPIGAIRGTLSLEGLRGSIAPGSGVGGGLSAAPGLRGDLDPV